MSSIKGRNTSPELTLRRYLRKLGIRFRGHIKQLPGKPDFVLQEQKKIIFVHGCFWHGHKRCSRAARPETNKAFWFNKIEGNILRDRRTNKELRQLGWTVLVIWQCQMKNEHTLLKRLDRFAKEAPSGCTG